MFDNIEAVIFDLDGTLIDSMWIWDEIDINYLKSKGTERPKDLAEKINHLSFHQVAEYFKKTFAISDTIEEILQDFHNLAYEQYLNNTKLKPGAKNFLDALKRNGIKIALATSNSSELLEVALNSNGISEYFDVITTTNEVHRGKNFPDVYLLTATRLEVAPEKCIVFEDIPAAVEGSKAAGMKVVAIHDEHSKSHKETLLSLADMYIEDFHQLNYV